MQRSLTIMMSVSGAVLGVLIGFSRDPVAGAVIGGILSTVTAVGLFFLSSKEKKPAAPDLVAIAATSMLWFYSFLVSATIVILFLAPFLPSNLDVERDAIKSLISSSGIAVVEVAGQQYKTDTQATQAATAILLTSKDIASEAHGLKLFANGTPINGPDAGIDIGGDYCSHLQKMIDSSGSDTASLKDFDQFTQNRPAKLAGQMLQALPADKILEFGKKLASVFCASTSTP
jgi:hypothetical protein